MQVQSKVALAPRCVVASWFSIDRVGAYCGTAVRDALRVHIIGRSDIAEASTQAIFRVALAFHSQIHEHASEKPNPRKQLSALLFRTRIAHLRTGFVISGFSSRGQGRRETSKRRSDFRALSIQSWMHCAPLLLLA